MWQRLRGLFGPTTSSSYDGKVYLLTNYSEYRGTIFEPDYVPIEDSFASAQIRRLREFVCRFYNRHSGGQALSDQDAADEANRLAFLRGSRRSNFVKTTKYSLLSFLPRVLFFQLTRIGNVIFLGVSFLQLIEDVSDSNGLPTYLIPLVFVIVVCLGRELASDLVRWRCDQEENGRAVHVFRDGRLQEMKLRDIRVGDVLKVYAYEYFPSDLVLLNCSDEQGVCNIETKNADGESNVKYKHVIPQLAELFSNDHDAAHTQIKIVCEAPTDSLSSFSGVACYINDNEDTAQSGSVAESERSTCTREDVATKIDMARSSVKKVNLQFDQLLLRGTSMVNTEWAYCVAVYVGNQTRLLKGSVGNSKRKNSKLEEMYQRNLFLVMMIMIVCVLASAVSSIYWLVTKAKYHTYLSISFDGSPLRTFFVTVGSMTLLLVAMIPVDLIIMWEIVRTIESKQICWNPEMVHEGKHAVSRSDQLIEDLAHITHIYSDKTGTLTQNVMTLKRMGFGSFGWVGPGDWCAHFWRIYESGSLEVQAMMRDFILVAALCHSVVIRKDTSRTPQSPRLLKSTNGVAKLFQVDDIEVLYDAASPDELALVNGMALLGCKFSSRPRLTEIELSLTTPEAQRFMLGEDEYDLWKLNSKEGTVPALRFSIRDVLAFDSNRKRMSVVIEDSCNRLLVLSKGADSALMNVMGRSQLLNINSLNEQLHDFASVGLRTLVLAVRGLSVDEYEAWHNSYSEALQLGEGREDAIEGCVSALELDMRIVGCTAIEDLLQEDVGEVLRDLKEAGIVIWVLTGDKLETALSIGRSTKLLNEDSCNAILSDPSPDVVLRELDRHLLNCIGGSRLDKEFRDHSDIFVRSISLNPPADCTSVPFRKGSASEFAKFCLTVTGEVLQTVYAVESLKVKFFKLAQYADVVIACRTTHKQKFELTRDNTMFNEHSTSLAIGDGANDVGMILTANVGVGIAGKEGNQACRSADFAIGEFRFLRQLLFVHGREALRKNTFLLYFCIFRNFSFSFVNVIYNFYTGFSGVSVFNTWSKQIINLCFTSFPLMFYVILDRQVPHTLLTKYPILYNTWSAKPINNLLRSLISPLDSHWLINRLRKRLNERRGIYDPLNFWGFIVAALWLSVFETLIILYLIDTVEFSYVDGSPINFGFNLFSQTMYVHHVLAVNAIVCLVSKTWFWPNHFFLWSETLVLLLFWLIVSVVPAFAYIPEAHVFLGTMETLHSSVTYYCVILLLLVVTLFPFWGYMYYTIIFNPSIEDEIAIQLKRGTFKGVAALRKPSIAYVADEGVVPGRDSSGFAFAIDTRDALLNAMHRTIHKIFKTEQTSSP
ncbi:phospholipid-translocating P-type ATPase, flippase family protein [Babesia divergens]|uniref:Phospholipid-transporting ATPase n=1 Tax=Babesia divergens TaxID=32595 RepID=A0AAD9G7V4_BABDI|nr:phospholipid-translocating P-type ATPase, flippase family protein [Babesia divergens]